jgi:hypothetical protein
VEEHSGDAAGDTRRRRGSARGSRQGRCGPARPVRSGGLNTKWARAAEKKKKKAPVMDWAKLILMLETNKKEYGLQKWLSNFIQGF